MNQKYFLLVFIFLFCSTLFSINLLWAESPPQSSSTHRELQFENKYVRVWKTIIMPKQPLNMHRHENGRVLVALKGGPLQTINESGKNIKTYHWDSGKAYWLDADPPGELHGDINNTDSPIEVMVIELKIRANI